MLFKNTASQGVYLFLIDSSTGAGKTGDASNISVTVSIDGGATSASTNSVSEIGGGVYTLTLSQAETNGDRLAIIPSSSTSSVVGSPIIAFTTGGAVPSAAAGASTGLALTSSVSDVETKVDTVDSNVDSILVDTGTTLPGTLATLATSSALSTVDTVVDAIKVVTDALPDSGALSSLATSSALATVDSNVDSILTDTGTTLPSTLSTIDTVVDSIKTVTDALPDSGALSSLATASALSTVDSNVDSILTDTGTTIPGTISTIDTVVDAIKVITDALPDSGALSSLATASALSTVDSNVDSILTDTGTTLPATLSTIDGKVDTVDTVVDSISSTLSSGVTCSSIADGAIGSDAVADIFSTTTIAESYASDGSAGTPAQLLYMVQQALTEFAISSTTVTVKKLDGSTSASTFTLDDASSPTSRTRAS